MRRFLVEEVALAWDEVGLRRARRLSVEFEFRDSGDGIVFSKVCLEFLQIMRA